jgi:hypothetical protein
MGSGNTTLYGLGTTTVSLAPAIAADSFAGSLASLLFESVQEGLALVPGGIFTALR